MAKQVKFKSAEHKRQYFEQQKSWEDIKKKYGADKPAMTTAPRPNTRPARNPRIAELRTLPSLDTSVKGAVTTGEKVKVYTGDKIIGIATMHKSNLVPIFNNDAAADVSKMRR